jgi:tetratricopeptide (TPR) repeat protein
MLARIPLHVQLFLLCLAPAFGTAASAATVEDWNKLQLQTDTYRFSRDKQKALVAAQAEMKMAEELGPLPRNLEMIESSSVTLAGVLESNKRYPEAAAARLRGLTLHAKYRGKDSPHLCIPLTSLAKTYTAMGKHAEAEAALKRVVEIKAKVDPDHQSGALMNLGQHYAAQKRYDDAEASFKRVLLQYEKEGGPNNPRLKPVLGLLSQMSSAAGRPRDAQAYTMRAARIRD